jgi:hypothetical protein
VVRRNRPIGLTTEDGMAVEDSDVLRRLRIHVEEVRWWYKRSFFFLFFLFFTSLLFWRCMVERDEQSEREKQQHREKEEGASLLCGRKRD